MVAEYDYKNSVVSIPINDYHEMLDRLKFLDALESAGVDNWEGFSFAHEIMEDESHGI